MSARYLQALIQATEEGPLGAQQHFTNLRQIDQEVCGTCAARVVCLVSLCVRYTLSLSFRRPFFLSSLSLSLSFSLPPLYLLLYMAISPSRCLLLEWSGRMWKKEGDLGLRGLLLESASFYAFCSFPFFPPLHLSRIVLVR